MGTSLRVNTAAGAMAVRSAGEGPPVLLVHGIPGSGRAWDGVASGLARAGFRTIVPDLLGFGGSERPEGIEGLWIDAQVDALMGVLDALGESAVHVVGHDYGAPVSVVLARRDPGRVRSLVLAAGNLFTDTPIPPPLRAVLLPAVGPLLGRFVFSATSLRMMLRFGAGRPRPVLDPGVYLGDPAQVRATGTIFRAALTELSVRYADVEAALGSLRAPRAVIWGDRDPFFPLLQGRRAAQALGAELIVASGAGHFLPAERPEAFVTVMRNLSERNGAGLGLRTSEG